MKSTSALILKHALKDDGLKEVPGPDSHPRIKQSILAAASWLNPDDSETAWCGCIRGTWGLETATGVPAAHYRAKNWLNWGVPVNIDDAQDGDTVIMKRPGGHHVTLFRGWHTESTFRAFGGNQSNACNTQTYKKADIIGIRRSLQDAA